MLVITPTPLPFQSASRARLQTADRPVGAVPSPQHACTALQGRNRRCITLDLHREEGRDVLRRLSDRADVLVENFRPGVMEKWGLGPNVGPPHLLQEAFTAFIVQVWPWLLLRSALVQMGSCLPPLLLLRQRQYADCHKLLL